MDLAVGLATYSSDGCTVPNIEQKFIADYIASEGGFFPNSFMDPYLKEKMIYKKYDFPEEESYVKYVSEIRKRIPHLRITPFAKSKMDDDVACFTENAGNFIGTVVVIHDFTEVGWENPRYFNTLSDWLQSHDDT